MLAINFSTSNVSFENQGTSEVVRILREIIKKIENGRVDGVVMDLNGNKIGTWDYSPEWEGKES